MGRSGTPGGKDSLGNQYHNRRPDTLQSLHQSAAVLGMLVPVLAKLLSSCLPALGWWYGKMPLECSLPAGRGKLHQGHGQTQGTAMDPWHGMAEGILQLRVEGTPLDGKDSH